jgi:hypothetical protein
MIPDRTSYRIRNDRKSNCHIQTDRIQPQQDVDGDRHVYQVTRQIRMNQVSTQVPRYEPGRDPNSTQVPRYEPDRNRDRGT